MSPEQVAVIITAVTPTVLAILTGIGWLIKTHVASLTKDGPSISTESSGSVEFITETAEYYRERGDRLESENGQLQKENARLLLLLVKHDIQPFPEGEPE